MRGQVLGAALGLVAGVGLVVAVSRVPALRRPSLEDRVGPYLRDASRPSRLLASTRTLTPFPTLERILGPAIGDGAKVLERVLGKSGPVRRRLEQAGRGMTLEEFRAEQLLWSAVALLGAVTLSVLLLADGSAHSPFPLAFFCLAAALAGLLGRDQWLSREVNEREKRMLLEFPTIAELLALAVSAGEGAVGSLERVTRISSGELSRELSRALADARSGASLVVALEGIGERTNLALLKRFVDGVVIAVERGTPLAEVLRAQAADVREASKRTLMESGGRKEIGMMVPIVFLVLPVTVAFALFPGLHNLVAIKS